MRHGCPPDFWAGSRAFYPELTETFFLGRRINIQASSGVARIPGRAGMHDPHFRRLGGNFT